MRLFVINFLVVCIIIASSAYGDSNWVKIIAGGTNGLVLTAYHEDITVYAFVNSTRQWWKFRIQEDTSVYIISYSGLVLTVNGECEQSNHLRLSNITWDPNESFFLNSDRTIVPQCNVSFYLAYKAPDQLIIHDKSADVTTYFHTSPIF